MIMGKENRDIKPLLFLFFINALGISILLVNGWNNVAYDIAIRSTVICMMSMFAYFVINRFKLGDPYLFIIAALLSTIGVIMLSRIYETMRENSKILDEFSVSLGTTQMVWFIIGALIYFAVILLYRAFSKLLPKMTLFFYGVAMFLFLITLLFGTGPSGSGVKNWVELGPVSVQPSEFIKILLILAFAAVLSKNNDMGIGWIGRKTNLYNPDTASEKKKKWAGLFLTTFIFASFAGGLILQREFGTMLLFGVLYIAFLYAFGESKIYLVGNIILAGVAVVAGGALLKLLAPESFNLIMDRINAWWDPLVDPSGTSYQVVRSLIAIGEGRYSGVGIGNGSPGYIPECQNDSIFAVICEEIGLMGGIAVLMLYFLLVYRGFKVALTTTNRFNKAVAFGISVVLGIQTFIIVGGITALIPLTGITLPFISAGGSSMISMFIMIGILQAISSMKGETTDELE